MTGLLAVVADVGSARGGEPAGTAAARGAGGGDVAKAAARQLWLSVHIHSIIHPADPPNVPAVVASLATTEAAALVSTGTALGAVSADVTVLAASVALAGRGAAVAVTGGSFGAFGGDVAGLVALRETALDPPARDERGEGNVLGSKSWGLARWCSPCSSGRAGCLRVNRIRTASRRFWQVAYTGSK